LIDVYVVVLKEGIAKVFCNVNDSQERKIHNEILPARTQIKENTYQHIKS